MNSVISHLPVTGVPKMASIPLYPSFSEICNLTAWYKMYRHGLINCTRKITRLTI
ncbi:MAG: hypothetical protein IPO94_13700 [Saprospiraceae bacterium]|nr:hypothetical protein [Saprospiraceae bacterium]